MRTVRRVILLVAIATLFLGVTAGTALADDVFVSALTGSDVLGDGSVASPYATIQWGVDKADPGDTVRVSAGLYRGSVDVRTDNVTVSGSGANSCILYAHDGAIGVSVMGLTSRWEGLTVTAPSGPCFFSFEGTLTVDSCTISGSTAYAGAGIRANYSRLTVIDSIISNNEELGTTVLDSGGGIRAVGTDVVLDSTIILGNVAPGGGAGIYVEDGDLNMVDCTVTENNAPGSGRGGGIRAIDATMTIQGSRIEDNLADYGGGAWFSGSTVTIEDSMIADNSSPGGGGGIRAVHSSLAATNCQFHDNRSSRDTGGAVSGSRETPMAFTRCDFARNFADFQGGSVYAEDGLLTFTDCTFTQSFSLREGGAIYATDGSELGLVGCDFTRNGTISSGGAVASFATTLTVERCEFRRNSSELGGGAIRTSDRVLLVRESLFAENTARYEGGGLSTSGSNGTVEECTFVRNQGGDTVAGMYARLPGVSVTNSIFWENINQSSIGPDDVSGSTPTYSSLQTTLAAPGNISEDPLFVDPSHGDYRLQAGSPCIDEATTTVSAATDLLGTARPQDGDEVPGARRDMGCYEYEDIAPVTTIDPDDDSWRSTPVTLTLSATDAGGVRETQYRLGDGDWMTYETPFVVSTEGTTTVGYRSWDFAGNVEATRTATVRIDSLGPIVSHAETEEWQHGPVTVELSSKPGGTIAYTVNGVPGGGATPLSFEVSGDGEHSIWYQATDVQGTDGPEGTLTIRIDDADPVTLSDIDSDWHDGPVAVTLDANDSHSGLLATFYDLGSGPVTYTAPFTISTEGETAVDYWSTDVVGNSDAGSGTVRIDYAPPEISVEPTDTEFFDVADFSIETSDTRSGVDAVRYRVDGGEIQEGINPSIIGTGDHTLEVWAVDMAGNESSHAVRAFTIRPSSTVVETCEGPDRYHTAVAVSETAFPGGADSVVIATGVSWPDALAGSALAGVLDAPILLAHTDSLPTAVHAELERLNPSKVYVLGGTAAVSEQVEGRLRELLGADGSLERIWGADRYQTADAIAMRVVDLLGEGYSGGAFVATGLDYPDAIAAAPVAVAQGWPIFLVGRNGLTPRTVDLMCGAGVTNARVLGGVGALSASVDTQLEEASIASLRLSGEDRYRTSVSVAEDAVANCGMKWNGVGVGTGEGFADALAGGVLQGREGSVMLLTRADRLAAGTAEALEAHRDHIASIRYLGGTGAVSDSVREDIARILR